MSITKQERLDELPTNIIIDRCISLDRGIALGKATQNMYKAELQSRGLDVIDNQNIRYTKFYATEGNAAIKDSMSLDILNPDKLKKLVGDGTYNRHTTTSTKTDIKCNDKFAQALKAVFTGAYTFEYDLDTFLDNMSLKPDTKQKNLLIKRLKGDYIKDKNTLLSVFKIIEDDTLDLDVELWYIHQIKNAELINNFFALDDLEEIRKCIMVESKIGITLDYDK